MEYPVVHRAAGREVEAKRSISVGDPGDLSTRRIPNAHAQDVLAIVAETGVIALLDNHPLVGGRHPCLYCKGSRSGKGRPGPEGDEILRSIQAERLSDLSHRIPGAHVERAVVATDSVISILFSGPPCHEAGGLLHGDAGCRWGSGPDSGERFGPIGVRGQCIPGVYIGIEIIRCHVHPPGVAVLAQADRVLHFLDGRRGVDEMPEAVRRVVVHPAGCQVVVRVRPVSRLIRVVGAFEVDDDIARRHVAFAGFGARVQHGQRSSGRTPVGQCLVLDVFI